jgi:hypothetical protein
LTTLEAVEFRVSMRPWLFDRRRGDEFIGRCRAKTGSRVTIAQRLLLVLTGLLATVIDRS